MRNPRSYLSAPRVLLGLLAVSVLLVFFIAGSTSTAAFGLYNPNWDGSRDLRTTASSMGAEVIVTTNASQYSDLPPNQTTAVVLSPHEYDKQSSQELRQFVQQGGTVLIAGDFHPGANTLLRDLSVRTRIQGGSVRNEKHYYRSPSLPVATNVNDSALPDVNQVTLNHGSVLNRTSNATVLVRMSEFAYIDTNRNQELDGGEQLAKYPVIARERLGAGQVIVTSDPSMFLNSMLSRRGNLAFARWLFTDTNTVLFDYSHTAGVPPLVALWMIFKQSLFLQLTVSAVLLGVLGLWSQYSFIDSLREWMRDDHSEIDLTTEEITTMLEQDHPEWDRKRLETVAKNITDVTTDSKKDD